MKQIRRKSPTTNADFNLLAAVAYSEDLAVCEIAEILGIDRMHAYKITSS